MNDILKRQKEREKRRYLKSNKAKVIRQLKRKGMTNGEIKLYGPEYLKQMNKGTKEEIDKSAWTPFQRAFADYKEKLNASKHSAGDSGGQ